MESISRISSMLETARDLTLEAARDAGAARRPARPLPAAQVKKLLDSRSQADVLDGLRRVVSMQYTSPLHVTLPFFPSVLKTLSNQTSSTRPLVYAYLVHHAEADPDTALLSVNTIQKSLSDSNPRVRAMALKTMSAIRVPVISQIVSLAIKKGVADMSPVVRKTAAFACVKCVKMDPSTLPQVTDYIKQLLGDKQYYVAGAAVAAFLEVCPERLDLVHGNYRGLVKKMVDMDEWGQLATLKIFTIYARRCFPRRTRQVKKMSAANVDKEKSFYAEEKDEGTENIEYEEREVLDPDLELFLDAALPLLQSRTSAVIVAVARAFLYLAPAQYLHHAVGPLVALLRGPQDIQQVGLYNVVQVCLAYPHLMVPYFRHFIFQSTEAPQIWRLKLEILTLIFPFCDQGKQNLTLAELAHFSRSHDGVLVREAVRAIGRCAQTTNAKTSARCLRLLLRQVHSPDQHLVAEALEVIRHLIQRDPTQHTKTVIRLAKNLDTLNSPTARASVIWLVGEFAGLVPIEESVAPDVLRILVRNYADETDEVRQQIVLLAAKVYLHWLNADNARTKEQRESNPPVEQSSSTVLSPEEDDGGFNDLSQSDTQSSEDKKKQHAISLLFHHTLLLARYTPSYDVRDRARLFRALLSVPASTELASLLLLAPKPVPQAPSPSESRKNYVLGSSTLVVGDEAGVSGLKGYEPLPDWVQAGDEPDAKLRDVVDTEYNPRATASVPASRMLDQAVRDKPVSQANTHKEKTLDSWLDEEEGEHESEETETEKEEDEDDETESEEEEDDDDNDDEEEEEESEEDESDDENERLVR